MPALVGNVTVEGSDIVSIVVVATTSAARSLGSCYLPRTVISAPEKANYALSFKLEYFSGSGGSLTLVINTLPVWKRQRTGMETHACTVLDRLRCVLGLINTITNGQPLPLAVLLQRHTTCRVGAFST
jgi:hypothetical protein